MKRLMLLLIMVMLTMTSVVISAQDDEGVNNDPTVNPRANACYADGTMADKCDTVWEWVCGWYLIRYEADLISEANFPNLCNSLLQTGETSETPAEPEPIVPGCLPFFTWYVNFNGDNYLPQGTQRYSDNTCTTPDGTTWLPIVWTLDGGAVADNLCDMNTPHNFGTHMSDGVYYCGPI